MVQTAQGTDTRLRIDYDNNIAVSVIVEEYLRSEGYSLRTRTYTLHPKGTFVETCLDECYKVFTKHLIVPRSRLEEIDADNPNGISLLTVLGADRETVEAHLAERDITLAEQETANRE